MNKLLERCKNKIISFVDYTNGAAFLDPRGRSCCSPTPAKSSWSHGKKSAWQLPWQPDWPPGASPPPTSQSFSSAPPGDMPCDVSAWAPGPSHHMMVGMQPPPVSKACKHHKAQIIIRNVNWDVNIYKCENAVYWYRHTCLCVCPSHPKIHLLRKYFNIFE